jgi:hypothetical protein
MAIERKFLGTARPALELVTDTLFDRFARQEQANLRAAVVVLPGGRAGRRLLERLVDEAERRKVCLTPPRILTVGQLPELLYQPQKPFADDLVQQLVWAEVLQAFDPDALQRVIAQLPRAGNDSATGEGAAGEGATGEGAKAWDDWLILGKLLQGLHRELASNALEFSDVVRRVDEIADPAGREKERWQLLSQLQRSYLARLDQLDLWDRQTARRVAIDQHECCAKEPIFLVGTVDLDGALRQMLDQVSQQVTALIYAPPQWADRFDAHGCLVPAPWQKAWLDLPDRQIIRADDPVDQTEAVGRRLAAYQGRFRADQITVGLPDEQIVPQLIRQLDACRLPNRFGPGQTLASSSVLRLLANLAEWLAASSYEAFAALVRHPDIEAWLLEAKVRPGWIDALDAYYHDHLPVKIDGTWFESDRDGQSLKAVYLRLAELTASLPPQRQPLDRHLPAVERLLFDLYGARTFHLAKDAERMTWKACREIQQVLGLLAAIPPALMPRTTAAETLQLVGSLLGRVQVPALATEAPIELVGWLELPLDDAPALVVTSFNQPFVPSSIQADPFLPGTLRSAMGLEDSRRRYARDAYAVSTLLAPWRDTTWIVARRTAKGDPLAPSRLLFATSPETVSRRALRYFSPAAPTVDRVPLAGSLATPLSEAAFEVPRPLHLERPITSMSVTSFAQYMACPYRFYLTYVLGLREVSDGVAELDGAAFGTLAHYVLEQFGKSAHKDACAAGPIEKALDGMLNRRVQQLFGPQPRAAVQIQVEQLRLRLHAFAQWQAGRRLQGWRIEHAELSFQKQPANLMVDDEPMQLTGRIDRIDFCESTGAWQILDYKTGDAGDGPDKTHRQRDTWIDLQLPLYRHLVRTLKLSGPVQLGYILLPKKPENVGLAEVDWSESLLASADEKAFQVVRQVRDQQFWPPTEPPPKYSEALAAICMDGVFGRKSTRVGEAARRTSAKPVT